jgi:hypothetical protein
MSPTTITKHDLLERKANIVRARLLRTIDALDRRRHAVTDVGEDAARLVKRAALPVGAGLGALLALTGVISFALHRRAERARRRHLGYWIGKAFLPPPPPRPSFIGETLRKATMAVVVAGLTELAKRQAAALTAAPADAVSPR